MLLILWGWQPSLDAIPRQSVLVQFTINLGPTSKAFLWPLWLSLLSPELSPPVSPLWSWKDQGPEGGSSVCLGNQAGALMVSMPIRGRERRGKRAGSSPEPLALLALKEKCVSRAHTVPLSDPFILQTTVLVLILSVLWWREVVWREGGRAEKHFLRGHKGLLLAGLKAEVDMVVKALESYLSDLGFPGGASGKEPACQWMELAFPALAGRFFTCWAIGKSQQLLWVLDKTLIHLILITVLWVLLFFSSAVGQKMPPPRMSTS